MDWMREGGFGMWAILLTAVITAALAGSRRGRARATTLLTGAVIVIAEGMLGMATGLAAVSAYVEKNPGENVGQVIGVGLGELSHNGTFAFALAALLGLAGWIFLKIAPTETKS